MRVWISVAVVAAGVALATPAVAGSASAPQMKAHAASKSDATDIGARRAYRRYARYPYAQRYPTYYARPVYYRPYPYGVPAPFFLGFAYLPFW